MRALVVGYFSTVGDLEVLSVVRSWLGSAGVLHDVSAFDARISTAITGSVDWRRCDPSSYTHLIVTCGPFTREFFVRTGFDLDRFAHCVRMGVNLSMIAPLEDYDPLDVVVGRDSDRWVRPDLSFLDSPGRLPVVGLCLAPPQREYGERQLHVDAGDALREAARRVGVAVQPLDTRWPEARNDGAVDSTAGFESLVSRLDAVLTTRLHGAVLALKNSVPVLAVDPVAGGDKVSRQMRAVGWPRVHRAEDVDVAALAEDLRWCLTPAGPALARECAERGRSGAATLREHFEEGLRAAPRGVESHTAPAHASPRSATERVAGAARRLIHGATRR